MLHELEGVATENGSPPKYERRAVLATQLQNALLARRVAKDNIEINQPIVDLLDSDTFKNSINKLKQKLGDIRKIENNQKDRIYFKRDTEKAPDNPDLANNLEKLIKDWKKKSKSKY